MEGGPTRVNVPVGEFGRTALAADAPGGLEQVVEAALIHYVGQLASGRAALRPPRFRRRAATSGRAVAIELDGDVAASLQSESTRQRIPLERLLEHAVLLYLADCHAPTARRDRRVASHVSIGRRRSSAHIAR